MAYSDFTLEMLEQNFGVQNRVERLFAPMPAIEPSAWLVQSLKIAQELPMRTEKAKSEWIVAPILSELRERNDKFFTIFSGDSLNADAEKGLNGECDFILAKEVRSFNINYPILQIVEAKKNDIDVGVPQCAAQLLGAKIFNEKKNAAVEKIYGCVTTGDDWLFLKLERDVFIDDQKYYLNDVGGLLAVFQFIIDDYKRLLK
jgi:hypothetical protein